MSVYPKPDRRFFREELYDEIAKIPLNDSVTLMMIDSKVGYEDLKRVIKHLKPFMGKDSLNGRDWINMTRIFSPGCASVYGYDLSTRMERIYPSSLGRAYSEFKVIWANIRDAANSLSSIFDVKEFKEAKEMFENAVNSLKAAKSTYEIFETGEKEKLTEAQIETLKSVAKMGRHSDNMDWVNSRYHEKLQKTIDSMIKRK